MTVEHSIVVRDIQAHPQVRSRVEAILREHFWQAESADVRQGFNLDEVMWGVAANPTLQQFVKDQMAAAPEGDELNVSRAVAMIEDEPLKYTVLSQAWPRLHPES